MILNTFSHSCIFYNNSKKKQRKLSEKRSVTFAPRKHVSVFLTRAHIYIRHVNELLFHDRPPRLVHNTQHFIPRVIFVHVHAPDVYGNRAMLKYGGAATLPDVDP